VFQDIKLLTVHVEASVAAGIFLEQLINAIASVVNGQRQFVQNWRMNTDKRYLLLSRALMQEVPKPLVKQAKFLFHAVVVIGAQTGLLKEILAIVIVPIKIGLWLNA